MAQARHKRRPQKRAQQRRTPGKGRRPGVLVKATGAGLLLLIALVSGLFAWSLQPGAIVGAVGEVVHFEVRTTDKAAVVQELQQDGLLASPLLTEVYLRFFAPGRAFLPRSHLLERGLSARQLAQRLASTGARQTRRITFPEGWHHQQMASRLEEQQICSELGFQAAVFDSALLDELGLETSAEGFLYPSTYEFYVDSDPKEVVRRLVKAARGRLAQLNASELSSELLDLGFGEREVVTLASIVEKETSAAQEAPRVARVFLNRLGTKNGETRGRLQSDPTAGYGCLVAPLVAPSCALYKDRILPAMLEDSANPYNTYRRAGLPPGPISNPGERSLRAVLQPAQGKELYFVADGNGGHTFSESFADHRKAIEQLRAKKGE